MKHLKLVCAYTLLVLCSCPVNATELSVTLKEKLTQAEINRDNGSYDQASDQLLAVLMEAQKNNDKLTQAMASAALGYNYYLSHDEDNSESLLKQSSLLSNELKLPSLSALIDDYLGMLYVSKHLINKAQTSFNNALKNAEIAKDNDLIVSVQVNKALLEAEDCNHLHQLELIKNSVLKLANEDLKIKLLLNVGEQLLVLNIDKLTEPDKSEWLSTTYQTFNEAYVLANASKKIRLRSQAEGNLGKLYAQQQRNQDALVWFDKAIADSQEVNATELSMQWDLQSAKALKLGGFVDASLNAYKRAVKHLSDIRYGLPDTLHNGQSSIKEIVDPVYRGLADVLLIHAAKTSNSELKQRLLNEAIDAMENIKQTELEEFFSDKCLIDEDTVTNIKNISFPGIGIVYPIVLPDRVELLYKEGMNTLIEQRTITVSATEVNAATAEMTQYLRTGRGNYRNLARNLYEWLFKPYDSVVKSKGISILVYVPDGALRQLPFSALLNGKRFLVEDYTIVTLPGLNLKNKVAQENKTSKALISALSKPDGSSIDELINHKTNVGVTGRDVSDSGIGSNLTREQLIEQLSLPGVNDEIKSLQKNVQNTTLENQSFTASRLKESVDSGLYSIVHVASHGYFGKNADESFVMTYDKNLKLNELKSILNDDNLKNNPIDLLTLSACQTAEGDDRALLGFSGMAIKSNALSAMGTLWSVDDVTTAQFMDVFYTNLSKMSKAQALRQVQISFINSKDLIKHPHYWSPFILVGDW
jgi:CHAT domain-containing protein